MITWIVGHILAVFIGVSLGLLGGGGSVLSVPVLVYVMGVSVKSAIPMTLAVVGIEGKLKHLCFPMGEFLVFKSHIS